MFKALCSTCREQKNNIINLVLRKFAVSKHQEKDKFSRTGRNHYFDEKRNFRVIFESGLEGWVLFQQGVLEERNNHEQWQ